VKFQEVVVHSIENCEADVAKQGQSNEAHKEIGQDRSRTLGLGPKSGLGCVVGPEFAPAMPCGLRLA
jgi:hypothetical protein